MFSQLLPIISLCILLMACQSQVEKTVNNKVSLQLNDTYKPQTFVYQCEHDFSFVAHTSESEKMWLFLPKKTIELKQVMAASGVKFMKEEQGESSITLWQKGQEAMFYIGDEKYTSCKNNRGAAIWEHAKLMGFDFRAIGQEPGWTLTISREFGIDYNGDYGQSFIQFSYVEPVQNDQEKMTVYQLITDGYQLDVTLKSGPCFDSMSGVEFETHVELKLNGKYLKGCGKSLH